MAHNGRSDTLASTKCRRASSSGRDACGSSKAGVSMARTKVPAFGADASVGYG
jgi:hypothetical protein